MDQLAVFLEAIRADGDDDIPRLVYADWLDEQGDPRGEFIRVQCEIARLESTGEAPTRLRELRLLERELLDEYKEKWTAPLDRWQAFVRFHRGLLDEASFRASDFVANASHILEMVPTLTHLRLRGSLRHIAELAQLPELSYLTGLELPMGFPRMQDLRTLLYSPHLERLRSLSLVNCLLGRNRCLPTLSPVFQQLTQLNLEGNGLDRKAIEWLLSSLNPGQLQSLNLARNNQDYRVASLMAHHDWEDQLQELDLSGNSIGPMGMQALAHGSLSKSLRTLKLSGCNIQDAGLDFLQESEGFPSLNSLDLSNNSIATFLLALRRCGWVEGLREINLSQNAFDHYELENLFAVVDPKLLVRLNLSYTRIGQYDMAAMNTLGQDHPMPRLRELDVSYCELSSKNLTRLIDSAHFDSLEKFVIGGNHLSNQVAKALLKSRFLDQLLSLGVFPPRPQFWSTAFPREFRTPAWRELKERLGKRVDIPRERWMTDE